VNGPSQSLKKPIIRFTREGRWWRRGALALWFIGVIKGIPLVVLLATLVLTSIAINWFVARRRLRNLAMRRWIEEPVFAQTPGTIQVEIENSQHRKIVGIRIEDSGPDHYLSWYLSGTDAGPLVRLRQTFVLSRRGRYTWGALRAVTSAPFGMVEATLTGEEAAPMIVLPRLGKVHRGRLRQLLTMASASLDHARLQSPALHPTAQGTLHGVRSFRTGDSPRWIHWRTSARRGELMVREFEKTPSEELIVVVDPWLTSKPAGRTDAQTTDLLVLPSGSIALEEAISLAATTCWEWCRQKGERLVLAVASREPKILDEMTTHNFALDLLECLALEEGTPDPDYPVLVERLASKGLPAAPVLLVSTRPNSFQDLLAARLNRAVAFVNVSDPSTLDFFESAAAHAR
jgi:uncharacterized protein (DUF58 family)